MEDRPYRLAVVANRPQPYHSVFFRALARRPELDLLVYYLSDIGVGAAADADFGAYQSDYPVLEGYPSRVLRNRSPWPSPARFGGRIHPELLSLLHRGRHDAALLQGWYGVSVWLAHSTCWARRLPVLFRSDVNSADPSASRWGALKRFVLPALFRRCRAFLTIGARNAEFYRGFGVPEEKCFRVPYTVDDDFFQRQRAALAPRRADIRRAFGVPADAVAFLYAGRLAPEKNLGVLLQALRRLADPRLWLLLAGEGRTRPALEEQARALGLTRVLFLGRQSQEQLARCYAAADVFVLPSAREPWGLVVNEAMNFGLPLVVSERVGAAPDLVEPGGNGLLFPADDPEALAGCLRALAADPGLRARLGARSLARVTEWSAPDAAETTLRAVEFALRK